MPNLAVHPTTRLIVWLLLLLAVQGLSGGALACAFAVLPLAGARGLRRGAKLVWRARWLLLSLFVIFAWGIAGTALWDGPYAPTQEGLSEVREHLGRLLLMLMAVAIFLERMSIADLLEATHTLLGPLRVVGFDADRGVVRLMLALRYVETLPRPRDWRVLLEAPETAGNEPIEVSHRPLRGLDYGITVLAVGGLLAFFFG
jgi:energy-coupling factor transporter transmembrane protein EcfT